MPLRWIPMVSSGSEMPLQADSEAEDRTQPPPGFTWDPDQSGAVVMRIALRTAVSQLVSGGDVLWMHLDEAWDWRDRMLALLSGDGSA